MATSTTNTTIDPGKLAAALRAKYGSVRNLLKTLGLDEALLKSSPGQRGLALD